MFKPIRWHSRRGYRPGFIVEYDGDHVTVLVVERIVRAKRVPLREEAFMRPLVKDGKPYPPEQAMRQLLDAVERRGATKAALKHLENVNRS